MPESLFSALISQGGFAVLAAFLGWLGYQQNKSAQGLLREVMELLKSASTAQATLTASIEGLRAEVVGLRSGIHGVRDLMAVFEKRLYDLERREP